MSEHPDDVITLSVGYEAEIYSCIHYKGLLKKSWNPSTSGVLPDKASAIEEITEAGKCDDENECSSSSDTKSDIESKVVENSRKDQQRNSRRRSHNAIRRRCSLYKWHRQQRLRQQKDKTPDETRYPKQKQPFPYKELTVKVSFDQSPRKN